MRTALDIPPGKLDPSEKAFLENIQKHGWFRTEIATDDRGPGFSFTTGFWLTLRQPELIIFSMNGESAHQIFWTAFNNAKKGRTLLVSSPTTELFENCAAFVLPVAKKHHASYLGWSRWFYNGDDFPCSQIIWPDRAGLFPWEASFSPAFSQSQPDLTERGWLTALPD